MQPQVVNAPDLRADLAVESRAESIRDDFAGRAGQSPIRHRIGARSATYDIATLLTQIRPRQNVIKAVNCRPLRNKARFSPRPFPRDPGQAPSRAGRSAPLKQMLRVVKSLKLSGKFELFAVQPVRVRTWAKLRRSGPAPTWFRRKSATFSFPRRRRARYRNQAQLGGDVCWLRGRPLDERRIFCGIGACLLFPCDSRTRQVRKTAVRFRTVLSDCRAGALDASRSPLPLWPDECPLCGPLLAGHRLRETVW